MKQRVVRGLLVGLLMLSTASAKPSRDNSEGPPSGFASRSSSPH